MRKNRVIAAVLSAAATVLALSACDAPRINPALPVTVLPPKPIPGLETVDTLTTTVPGSILKARGYTPVTYQFNENHTEVTGAVYVHCPANESTYECGAELHNRGAADNPNVYVVKNKSTGVNMVTRLEGQHTGDGDDRSYNLTVPTEYQDFSKLSKEQIDGLLGVAMTHIDTLYAEGDLVTDKAHSLRLKLDDKSDGLTIDAWTYVPIAGL